MAQEFSKGDRVKLTSIYLASADKLTRNDFSRELVITDLQEGIAYLYNGKKGHITCSVRFLRKV
jgi:hypothetical protein